MEFVAIAYLVICAVLALFNPFIFKGNMLGHYFARLVICVLATPIFYLFLFGSATLFHLDPKYNRKNWEADKNIANQKPARR
ncbi:MAG: hypothetical protein H7Y04_16375 [Verrucomicrobia bacterium]|nr:hypothetical protein [Cytophagales bacterium]